MHYFKEEFDEELYVTDCFREIEHVVFVLTVLLPEGVKLLVDIEAVDKRVHHHATSRGASCEHAWWSHLHRLLHKVL